MPSSLSRTPDPNRWFLKPWKPRRPVPIQRPFRGTLSSFARSVDLSEPVWQARCDDFHLSSAPKVEETWIDLPPDPVRAGLAAHPCDGPWSSARYDEPGRTVGVPVGWLDGESVKESTQGDKSTKFDMRKSF
jgi:putative transposase